ncbi:dihydrofolate reductase [Arthrobacter deserti]|uniref:Dihydrofolate reductase n=1 Tax=Arthrobacter deserti TaxID=1742687 RepID=A0ABX1JIP6_9MICC|nr:dihydrofolate reductase [Arthrobacter deserti]
MARTVYYVASSLDGFIAEPQDNLDWLLQFIDLEGVQDTYQDFFAGVGAIVMGSATYRFVLGAGGWGFGSTPAWVYTNHDLPDVPGADITSVRGGVGQDHEAVRAAAGQKDIWVVGGGGLAGQYLEAGLLDEMILTLVPVTLARGKPLLPVSTAGAPAELLGSRTLGGSMVELHYRFAQPEKRE